MNQGPPPLFPKDSAIDLAAAFAMALHACGWSPATRRTHPVTAVLCDLSAWWPWNEEALALIDVAERARVDRLHDVLDRGERALTYALHRLLLAAWLGEAPGRVPISRDGDGCPRLQGAHGNVFTSLSHPRGFAAFAMSDEGNVGIDLEPASHAVGMDEIAGLATHADELDALACLDEGERMRALLAIWVRKEAYLKAEGVGLRRSPSAFPAMTGIRLPSLHAAAGLELRMLEAGPHHVAAVALPWGSDVHGFWLWPPASP